MGYLNSIKAGALETWKVYKILPSVVGAQGALESGWGTSRLAKPPYNNQFGIKPGNDWTGKTITMPTREYVNGAWITENEPFRWYDDPGESIRDHGAFFTSTEWRRNNYKAVVGETDYKKACWALQNAPAPYATDPGYAQKLINLIETHNLQAWDREAMAGNSNTVATQTKQTVASKIVGRELSSAGRTYVKDLNVTMIGDSLGVGTKPHFESLVPKANYDVLGSRQITHATNSLNGTYILQQLKNAGNLKEYVVVILGTNRGVTEQEINTFVSIAGSDRKIIFVDTASEVGHSNTVSVHYENSAKRLSNVYYANWKTTAIPLRPQYYNRDGANGEYIHMTPTGYRKHAEFIAQALYEVATTNFTDRVAETTKTEYFDIKDLELNEDGLITYDVLESNSDGTSTKKKATKQTNIKGLYSPYGDSSIYNPEANRMYGFGSSVNNSNWRESYFEDNEIEDSVRLLEMASAELLERQEPEMIYTVNLLEIPVELSIGDTGIFVDHEFSPPLYLQARVLSLTTSETNPSLNRVTIGNVTELEPQDKSALMALRAELQETRKDLESNWIGSISTNMTVVSTNGYVLGDRTRETSLVAKVLKGKEDITNQYDKFTWERISEDGSKDSVYNDSLANSVQSSVLTVYEADIIGNQSKFVARAFNAKNELVSHQEIVLKRVETAIWVDTDTPPAYATDGSTWVNQDGEQYVKVDGEWEKRVDQAKIFTVEQDITEAKDIADNAKQEADDARQRAEDALTEVGISTDLAQTAKDLAQLAKGNAETAKANAQTAINEAGIAASQAVQAINTADTAKTNAQTALTEAGNAKTTANNLSIRVDDVEAEVELKANQTTVDGLSGTVSNHSTTLSQHANQIASKADSSVVNTIKGTVDTHATEISQNASDIKSKASTSSVNTLTGRVTTAETNITQTSTALTSKADKSVVDTLSNTVSTQGTTLSQQADLIALKANTTTVNTLVGRVSTAESNISLNASGLSQRYTKSEVDTRLNGKATQADINESILNDKRIKDTQYANELPSWYRTNYPMQTVTEFKTLATMGVTGESTYGLLTTEVQWANTTGGRIKQTLKTNTNTHVRQSNDSDTAWLAWKIQADRTYVDTQINVEAGRVEQLITQVKTNPQGTITGYNQLVNTHNSMQQAIGTNGEKIAQMVMTDSVFKTTVAKRSDVFKNYRVYAISHSNRNASWAKWGNSRIIKPNGSLAPTNSNHIDRSYFLYVMSENGSEIYSKVFDVWGDVNQATYLANIIKSFTNRQYLIILMGSHSPTNNRTAGGLPQAIYEIGGSPEIFINEDWSKQPAYLLVGKPGLGQGRGYEYFVPASQGGSFDITIPVLNGSSPFIDSSIQAVNSQVTQLASNWAVRMLNSKNDIVSQINLSDSTFLIEAKNIVGLGDAVINGKLTVTQDMIAGAISADKIRGGTISGTTFRTDDTANNFRMTLHGGRIDFMHGNTTLGSLYSTLDSQTKVVNGVANIQTPGYIYSINSRSSSSSQSRPVIQIPENSSMESRKLNIWAQGGFRVESDTLTINSEHIRALKPFVAGGGFQASHEYGTEGASIKDSGNLLYVMDKVGSMPIHRFQPRKKDGTIVNAGIAIYEDGRVAVVKNGVWRQL